MKMISPYAENLPTGVLHSKKLIAFFINHLNRIYCAKSHLQKNLPEMREHAHFSDLINAITETLIDVEKQISRMDEIYAILDVRPGFEDCLGVIGLIDDTFSVISQEIDDPEMSDLSILFYLQNIEAIEMASFKMLNLAAPKLGHKDIKQLLKENFDEAQEDLVLLQEITSKYLQ
jgi:ferritin-like metal-binding protein YciE